MSQYWSLPSSIIEGKGNYIYRVICSGCQLPTFVATVPIEPWKCEYLVNRADARSKCGSYLYPKDAKPQPNWVRHYGKPCPHGFFKSEGCSYKDCVYSYQRRLAPQVQGKQQPGAVRLWRFWTVPRRHNPRLASTATTYLWTPAAQQAHLLPSRGDYGARGFHGFKTVEAAFKSANNFYGGYPLVFGSFLAWGRVVEHSLGFRTEWAQPESIVYGQVKRLREPSINPHGDYSTYITNTQPIPYISTDHYTYNTYGISADNYTATQPLVDYYDLTMLKSLEDAKELGKQLVVPFDELSIRHDDDVLHRELYGDE